MAGCLLALLYRQFPYKIAGQWLFVALAGFIACPFLSNTPVAIFLTCFVLCATGILYATSQPLRPLVYVGNASYSIYLTHLTVIAMATSLIKQPFFLLPLFFISVLAGLLFYRYAESPVLRMLNKRPGLAQSVNKDRPEEGPLARRKIVPS